MLKNELKDIISKANYEKSNKWYNDYIEDVDLEKIEWKKFNYNELMCFFHQNYYDEDYESFVMVRDEDNVFNNSGVEYVFLPFGMTYLSFNKLDPKDEYLVGLVKNKKGLKTIACCMIFKPKCLLEYDSIKPVTYIETIETNLFFQCNGLFNQMIEVLPQFIDNDQNILITPQNGTGEVIGITKRIKRILMEQGFRSDVRSEYEIDEEYLKSLKQCKTKIK